VYESYCLPAPTVPPGRPEAHQPAMLRSMSRLKPVVSGLLGGGAIGLWASSGTHVTCAADSGKWSGFTTGPTPDADAPKIVVVGSTNVDLVAYCPTLPRPGETLMGTNFIQCFGGKGANQAVLAARLGAAVTMVTKVGPDGMGQECRANYAENGVDTTYVFTAEEGVPTGVAPITVDESGENVIVVVSGANMKLTVAELETARATIAAAQVVVCQMEVPLEVNQAAMAAAREAGVPTILNVAPCPVDGQLPSTIYALTDVRRRIARRSRTMRPLPPAAAARRRWPGLAWYSGCVCCRHAWRCAGVVRERDRAADARRW
jgi:hypothetical protein